jgi:hypothetical protein
MAVLKIEAEVIDLIAHERGLPRHKVTLCSRLLHDLGMDGDDAVEFFQDFAKRYDADLTALYHHWDRHFGPEGFGSPMMFLSGIVLVLLPLPLMPLGISPALIWGLELAAVLLWLWPLKQWPLKDKTIPITVEDVVKAARTRHWPVSYAETP